MPLDLNGLIAGCWAKAAAVRKTNAARMIVKLKCLRRLMRILTPDLLGCAVSSAVWFWSHFRFYHRTIHFHEHSKTYGGSASRYPGALISYGFSRLQVVR